MANQSEGGRTDWRRIFSCSKGLHHENVIYLDEIIFKARSILYKTWEYKGSNQFLDKEGINVATLAAMVATDL
jgi:hypothetical protein